MADVTDGEEPGLLADGLVTRLYGPIDPIIEKNGPCYGYAFEGPDGDRELPVEKFSQYFFRKG